MKLLARYNRVNVFTAIVVLIVSSICYYFIIRQVLINQLDKDLRVEEEEITDYVQLNNSLPNPMSYKDQQTSYEELYRPSIYRTTQNLELYDSIENEYLDSRRLIFPIKVSGKNYKISITKSEEETENMLQLIVLITLGIVVLLLATLFLVNRFFFNRLWQPFNNTLTQLKQFNLSGKKNIHLEGTNIHEFKELNEAVFIMTGQVRQDYNTLKTFTENASHEMQTPLAIINSKLDLLIQDDAISEYQLQQLQGIYDAKDRLSKLNQSLLLLTKIENNQFNDAENVDITQLIHEKLDQFDELIHNKKLAIHTALQPLTIRCNKQLTEIMIGNLLNNAIRYNKDNGNITLTIEDNTFTISNTSILTMLDEGQVFQRFYRHTDTGQDGNGLGLSIIKQVCDVYGFKTGYYFSNELHSFFIQFSTPRT
ncbi:HAMP domain-containing sensor histidine kinase [soil metagenome]